MHLILATLFLTLFASLATAQTPSGAESTGTERNDTELNCRIEPHVTVNVSSAVEGLISEVLVDKNHRVQQGDVLARLEAGLEAATAELRKVQAELESDVDAQQLAFDFSQRALTRVTNLYEKKAASFAELDKAKTEHALAAQQLQQANDRKRQAALEHNRALADLQRRTILSPIDGIVVDRYKQPGEHIDYEPVLQLAQLDPLRVEVFAPASLYGLIKEGMKARITPELAIAKKSYLAEVVLVDQVIDAPSNTFGIRLSFPNPDYQLPSGLKCKVRFSGIKSPDHLLSGEF